MMLREKIVRFCLLLLRLGMGGFFLFVAGRKLFHLDQLQATIDRFAIFPEAWGHPLACLGVVVPGSRGLHDGAERLRIPQTLFPPFPRPDERGKMTFGTMDGKLRRECSLSLTLMAPERRHPVSLSWVWHNSLGRQSSGLPLFSPE